MSEEATITSVTMAMADELKDDMPFKCGEIVRLKSGGPWMTVSGFDNGSTTCTWFQSSYNNQAGVLSHYGEPLVRAFRSDTLVAQKESA